MKALLDNALTTSRGDVTRVAFIEDDLDLIEVMTALFEGQLVWTLVESLGYRQLTVLWRLRGLWKFLRKNTDWGEMQRRGFAGAQSASNPPDA